MSIKAVCWITNITKANISLHDLNITINAHASINLLDERHYSLTYDQVKKSILTGSISRAKNKLVIRKHAPEETIRNIAVVYDSYIPSRQRSILETKEEKYEELNISDEEFIDNEVETKKGNSDAK